MAASEKETLTYSDIRRLAKERLLSSGDLAAVCTIYMLTWGGFVFLAEMLIYRIAGFMNIRGYRPLSVGFYSSSPTAAALLAVRIVLYHILFVALSYIVRRHYIDITEGNFGVERFMSKHRHRIFYPSIKCGFCLSMFKALVSLPLIPGIYGIVHFYRAGSVGEINTTDLIYFMLSMGFTLVWAGMLIHYFMSLSLVKYIIELNPRADFFEACDLSIKLMAGWHTKVFVFMLTMLPYALSCLLLYPAFIAVPFITECRLLLAKEIMGEHWQDKIPAMAKRWEKQMKREKD